MSSPVPDAGSWPSLPYEAWKSTCRTLHLWTQVVGKVRFSQGPWINHSWGVTLYVTARGLTTSPMPDGVRTFQIDFDFINHALSIVTSDGRQTGFPLRPRSVADFYRNLVHELKTLGIRPEFSPMPNEVPYPTRFDLDESNNTYDAEHAHRYWRALVRVDSVFKKFRARFTGKCSPVHFFWGTRDLSVTRFSGRPAPVHPGGVPYLPDWVSRDAYTHELSSCGFLPGGGPIPYPAFYSYAYPEPGGFANANVAPEQAYYLHDLHQFVLPYDAVRLSPAPEDTLLEFLQSAYEASADLAKWDRPLLEYQDEPRVRARARVAQASAPRRRPRPTRGEIVITVTGATGLIGNELLRLLSEAGQPTRAVSRSAGRTTPRPGVEWVLADLGDPRVLEPVLAGTSRLFLLTDNQPGFGELQLKVIRLARELGVEHIVKVSALGASDHSRSWIGREHWRVEQALFESPESLMRWTILRPHAFMQNWLGEVAETVRADGKIYSAIEGGKVPFIDARDIAAVAAEVLRHPEGHVNAKRVLTGGEAVGFDQLAEALSNATGKPITYQPISMEEAGQRMRAQGASESSIEAMLALAAYQRAGGATAQVSAHVQQILGRSPRSIGDFAREYSAQFQGH
jgi:uncharacterized protein YbjT (DUF2867 family)